MSLDIENQTSLPSKEVTRSPLINETMRKELDSLGDDEKGKALLIERIIEETVQREKARVDFATRIRPDLYQAILDTITHYGWTNIIYMYNSNEGEDDIWLKKAVM